jgi:putative ABC transport system permease protein
MMLRNYLKSALGDLRRHPWQSAIAIGGLAIGLMAAIAAGISILSLFTYNHFVPGYDRIYYAIAEFHDAKSDQHSNGTPRELAGYLKSFPEVEKVARIHGDPQVLRHGDVQARLTVNWADPEFFRIYQAPVVYGDLSTALDTPDGMVLTRGAARQFFGRENVIGETLEMNREHNFRVTAIIEDWPVNNSTYRATAFASSLASFSVMNEATPGLTYGNMNSRVATLIRLAPGSSLEKLNGRATAILSRFVPPGSPYRRAMHFERIDRLVISPNLNPDMLPRVTMIGSVALIILLLACVNFINLAVARSAQRGLEVGIRKATGARRSALIVQFLSETILQVMLALVVAVAVVETFLPNINSFMNSGATFNYWRDPVLLGALLLGVLFVGVLAGSYPQRAPAPYPGGAAILGHDRVLDFRQRGAAPEHLCQHRSHARAGGSDGADHHAPMHHIL